MEWLLFIVVCWAAIRFLGAGRCGPAFDRLELLRRRQQLRERRQELRDRRQESRERKEGMRAARGTTIVTSGQRLAPSETAEERLRRQYVEGTLSVDQYERELDALYRKHA